VGDDEDQREATSKSDILAIGIVADQLEGVVSHR
jgi:hypothetical protein